MIDSPQQPNLSRNEAGDKQNAKRREEMCSRAEKAIEFTDTTEHLL